MNLENPALPAPATVLVVCLCAEWCGVCRDYASCFAQVQSKFPQAQFIWMDVEDQADLLHPLDVADFPTLLLAVGNKPHFFGPVTPQPGTLERLIRAQSQDADAPTLANRAVADLVARIRAAKLA